MNMSNFNMLQTNNTMNAINTIDPNNMPVQYKRLIIQENIALSKLYEYKIFPKYSPTYNKFIPTYDAGNSDNLYNVFVFHEHSIDVAEKYAEKGQQISPDNGLKPVIVNQVTKDFIGTNFETSAELKDEMINMRTNLNCVFGSGSYNREPVLGNNQVCLYSPVVTTIRNKNFEKLPFPQVFRFGLISITPVNKPQLLDEHTMIINDYKKTLCLIETIFQTAIANEHKALILPPFGLFSDENPIEDIIKIYNYCIFKYGHKIGTIAIAIPPYCPKHIFDIYDKKIIRPQNMFLKVDEKYDQLEFETKLSTKSSNNLHTEKLSNDQNNNISQEQMQNFMKLMSSNPMMMNMMQQYSKF